MQISITTQYMFNGDILSLDVDLDGSGKATTSKKTFVVVDFVFYTDDGTSVFCDPNGLFTEEGTRIGDRI